MTRHAVVTGAPRKKKVVYVLCILSYSRLRTPADELLKTIRRSVRLFACNNSRKSEWIFVKFGVGEYYEHVHAFLRAFRE